MGEKTNQKNNYFCLPLLMRRKDHGIAGTFCSCKNLDSQVPIRMKTTQKPQTCTWNQMKHICGKNHNLQWHEHLHNCASKFSGVTTLMTSPSTSLGAFAKLCLSCVYRTESLLAEGLQDGQWPEHWSHRHVRRSAVREGLLSGVVAGSLSSHSPSPVAGPDGLFITQGEKIGGKAGVNCRSGRRV